MWSVLDGVLILKQKINLPFKPFFTYFLWSLEKGDEHRLFNSTWTHTHHHVLHLKHIGN